MIENLQQLIIVTWLI